jgi:hypothetical protein
MIRAWGNTISGLIATTVALCLSACATDAPRNDPILAFARALGISGTPSCPTMTVQDHGAQSNCTATQAIQSPIPTARTDYPHSASAPPNRDRPGEDEGGWSSVPRLDVEESCRYSGEIAADTNVSRCLLDERGAHDQLVRAWSGFPVADRSQCTRYSTRSGGGTYTDLLTCLEMSVHADELHAKNRAIARQYDSAKVAGDR